MVLLQGEREQEREREKERGKGGGGRERGSQLIIITTETRELGYLSVCHNAGVGTVDVNSRAPREDQMKVMMNIIIFQPKP
jgi:hypothetical protein